MDPHDKTFVVTGGGNGIGREVVLELLRRGARVAAVDIRPASLDETAALSEPADHLATFVVDITDREATEALPIQVAQRLGPADAVINVAGIIQPFVKLTDLDYVAIERVIDINLYGTIHVNKAFLPTLLNRPEAHLANVSSMGGFFPFPGQTIYGATKAAVKLMTEGLYAELLDTNVGVSVIMPGAIETEITKNSGVDVPGVDPERAGKFPTTSAADAARIILDGVAEGKLHIYVGRDSRLMGLFNRISPKWSIHLIQRKMKSLLS